MHRCKLSMSHAPMFSGCWLLKCKLLTGFKVSWAPEKVGCWSRIRQSTIWIFCIDLFRRSHVVTDIYLATYLPTYLSVQFSSLIFCVHFTTQSTRVGANVPQKMLTAKKKNSSEVFHTYYTSSFSWIFPEVLHFTTNSPQISWHDWKAQSSPSQSETLHRVEAGRTLVWCNSCWKAFTGLE